MRKNPYANLSKEEALKQELDKKALDKKISEAIKLGQKCLNHEGFLKYRQEYEKAKEDIIDLMIAYTEPDPVKFAFFAKACLSKIDAMKMLLDIVSKDAKKKVIDGK